MRSRPSEPPTTTDSWVFLVKTNMAEPPFSWLDPTVRATESEKKADVVE
jgi:hypothetical protein